MNITRSLAKSLIDKDKTRVYFVSCSRDLQDIAKERFFLGCSHLKLYRTDSKVFISTSNLSLSSWDELTVELARNEKLDMFIAEIEKNLKSKNDFIKEFW
jgi:DNA replication protein DnaC